MITNEFLADYMDRPIPWGPIGELTYTRTYAREGETWPLTCARVINGMFDILREHCLNERRPWDESRARRTAEEAFDRMFHFKWLPPGRGLWNMGTDTVALKGGAVLNNCGFVSTGDVREFSEPFAWLMDMSMLGVGVGFDTLGAGQHLISTPFIEPFRFTVQDTREGWVECVRLIIDAHTRTRPLPDIIDFSKIRPLGAKLNGVGGTASGPGPLIELVRDLLRVFNAGVRIVEDVEEHKARTGRLSMRLAVRGETPRLVTSEDIVDIATCIGKAVASGGIRRSALIALGEHDDETYLNLKDNTDALAHNRWAANNSIIGYRGMDYGPVIERICRGDDLGIVWLDNVKAFSRMLDKPDFIDRAACGTNPCVPGDTIVQTIHGPRTVDSLVNRAYLVNDNGQAEVCGTGMFYTGDKEVFRVITQEGHELRATANHEILMADGQWVELGNLVKGDKIQLNRPTGSWGGEGSFEQGWLLGNLLGDGHFSEGSAFLGYWGENKEYMLNEIALPFIENLGGPEHYHAMRTGNMMEEKDRCCTGSRRLMELAVAWGVNPDDKQLDATRLLTSSEAFHRGLLRGIFDADGSPQGHAKKGISVRLSSVCQQHLKVIQQMLLNLGINSTCYFRREAGEHALPNGRGGLKDYYCQDVYELIISKENLRTFADRVGFYDPAKNARLTELLGSYKRALYKDKFVARVKSIESIGVMPVYDCTVPSTSRFNADGFIVHNCSEQSLHNRELCCLVETFPERHPDHVDYYRTLKIAYLYAKAVTLVPIHDRVTDKVVKQNRRIGCSQSGIVQVLGKFRNYYTDFCQGAYEEIRRLDVVYSRWLGINQSIKTTSVKPSGSVSTLPGATPGIHAAHAPYYLRRVRLENTSPLINQLAAQGYSLEPCVYAPNTTVVSIPVHEEAAFYKSDHGLMEQLELACRLQGHWADNQVSVTFTFTEDEQHLLPEFLARAENELKSVSFLKLYDHGYAQAPYEEITREEYETAIARIAKAPLVGRHEVTDKFCDGDKCVL